MFLFYYWFGECQSFRTMSHFEFVKYVALPICRLFLVLTHFLLRPVERPAITCREDSSSLWSVWVKPARLIIRLLFLNLSNSTKISTDSEMSSHRHYIFELIQTGIDPCPPLSLQQGLGDLLVGVRLRDRSLTLLPPMLGCGGTIATHDYHSLQAGCDW